MHFLTRSKGLRVYFVVYDTFRTAFLFEHKKVIGHLKRNGIIRGMESFFKHERSLSMANEVLKVSAETIKEMETFYQNHLKQPAPPGSVFAAKKGPVSITAYRSGKVLFQGSRSEQEAEIWQKEATTQAPKKKTVKATHLPKDFSNWSVIGSDEVGTGSYFGPLTVVAAYVPKEKIALVKELGVRDSKDMRDTEIISVAKDLLTFLPHSLLTVMPEKYNAIQPSMSQGKMKAILHNQALNHLMTKIAPDQPDGILIDQFELPSTYFKHIQDQPIQVREKVFFETKGESHHLAVAAASILARYAFLKGLDTLTAKAGLTIPSGAGSNVDLVAARLLKKGGLSYLGQFAKLHFANTEKAKKIAGFK